MQYNPSQQPHPYRKLGGWLLLIVIGNIAGVFISIYQIVNLGNMISIINSVGRLLGLQGFSGLLTVAMVLTIISLVGVLFYIVSILRRSPNLIVIFHVVVTIDILGALMILIALGSMGFSEAIDASSVGGLIGAVAGAIIWTLYFSRSVRVRTYMGSDEYLRRSPITRTVQSPVPADWQSATTPGAYTPPQETQRPDSFTAPPVQRSFCGSCGAEMKSDAQFCGVCGWRRV